MHRAIVNTREVEKIIPLPGYLKRLSSVELIITPPFNRKKAGLKKKMAAVFEKAKKIKIVENVKIDELMSDMNDALL